MITLFDQEIIMKNYMKETFDKGLVQGHKEGRAEGQKENSIEIAKRMLCKAMAPELVAELCDLPLDEVHAIKNQLSH